MRLLNKFAGMILLLLRLAPGLSGVNCYTILLAKMFIIAFF